MLYAFIKEKIMQTFGFISTMRRTK